LSKTNDSCGLAPSRNVSAGDRHVARQRGVAVARLGAAGEARGGVAERLAGVGERLAVHVLVEDGKEREIDVFGRQSLRQAVENARRDVGQVAERLLK